MDRGVIEIAPLAYMRGRTLSQAFVILDEAQNTTTEQMFMFLTRLGEDSKCVVTGGSDADRSAAQQAQRPDRGGGGAGQGGRHWISLFRRDGCGSSPAGSGDRSCVPGTSRIAGGAILGISLGSFASMWNFFQRRRLVGKGMACGKTRRTVADSKFTEALECAWPIQMLILGGFVAGLATLIFTGQQERAGEEVPALPSDLCNRGCPALD